MRSCLPALLCLALATHSCLSAVVITAENEQIGEEIIYKSSEFDAEEDNLISSKNILGEERAITEQSSSEDGSHKYNGRSKANNNASSEESSSSSGEQKNDKVISKRSVESQNDNVNNIEDSFNQTIAKDNSVAGKDDASHPESNTGTSESSPLQDVTSFTTTQLKDFATSEQSPDSPPADNECSETTTEVYYTTEINEEITEQQTTNSDSDTVTESTSITETVSSSVEDFDKEISSSSTIPSESLSPTPDEINNKTLEDVTKETVDKLSVQIRKVLATYREKGVVQLPGQTFFQDPMPLQDFKQSFGYYGTMHFKNMSVFGLSNFTVEHINTDVDRLQVYILLKMQRLVILGNYTLNSFFSSKSGPFNVTLLDVDSEGVAEVAQAPEGYLEATDSVMNMVTNDMKLTFKNSGLDSLLESVGGAVFESIKPQILETVNSVIRNDINIKLKDFSSKFIKKVSPVELAFSEGRKYARTHGYDPYHIKDKHFNVGLVDIQISELMTHGLSKFYRVGNLSLSMDSGCILIGVHVATGELTGHCHWTGHTFGISKSGKTNFTVDHLQVRAVINQSLDITQKPQLDDLDLELGLVKVTMDNKEPLSLLIEHIINLFPKLLRHMIVDTLEQPLKEKIQEILDKINVESIVDENLPRLDSFGL